MPAHLSSYGELTAMPPDELRRDVATQRTLVRKMRLGIELKKEKDTARYRREKRQLSRMLTAYAALTSKSMKKSQSTGLKGKPKSRTVPSSALRATEGRPSSATSARLGASADRSASSSTSAS